MICHKCGANLDDGAAFCYKCGMKVTPLKRSDVKEEITEKVVKNEVIQPIENNSETNNSLENKEYVDEKIWNEASKTKKVLFVLGGIILVIVLIVILKKYGAIIGCVAMVGCLIYTSIKGNAEERKEIKKSIIKFMIMLVVVCGIGFVATIKPGYIENTTTNFVRPGAGVRDAYLTQYSDTVTIEKAFDNYFEKGKWDTYKNDGYDYVTFIGSCMYMETKSDVRITFKITGENFIVESLDVNGRRQSELVLYALLESVYENYE